MSISIGASDYLTSTYQNGLLTSAERDLQKAAEAKSTKAEQSTVSANLDKISLGEEGIAVNEVSRQQGSAQTTGRQRSARVDTVEISDEGRAASARLQSQEETAVTELEESEATSLSDYTDSELKQMYYKGEITLQEYEDGTGETLE